MSARLEMADVVNSFEDIAYKHDYFVHCPDKGVGCRCECPATNSKAAGADIDIDRSDWYSCLPKWRIAMESTLQ